MDLSQQQEKREKLKQRGKFNVEQIPDPTISHPALAPAQHASPKWSESPEARPLSSSILHVPPEQRGKFYMEQILGRSFSHPAPAPPESPRRSVSPEAHSLSSFINVSPEQGFTFTNGLEDLTLDLKTKDNLLRLLRSRPEGIPVEDFKNSCPEMLIHVEELRESGDIWLIENIDSQEIIAYPKDPRVEAKLEELKKSGKIIKLPIDDVEKELKNAGIESATKRSH